jgi:uncharacterized alkaline shock family protein YloU
MAENRRQGKIEISPTAISSIASQAILECYGVVGMAPRTLRNELADVLLPRDSHKKGVEVKFVEEQIVIDLYVIIEYGVRVSEVANNIMESVKFNVEKALGVPVSEVNVHVQGLRVSEGD